MTKYLMVVILMAGLVGCASTRQDLKKIDQLLLTRQQAYASNDVETMMSTYHPDYRQGEMNFSLKMSWFSEYFKEGQSYSFSFSNIRFAKRKNIYYVTYDYTLEKNMTQEGRGFSMKNTDQRLTLVPFENRLVEYGDHD